MQSTITEALKEAFSHEEETFICSHCHKEFSAEKKMCFDGEELCTACYGEHTVCCSYSSC